MTKLISTVLTGALVLTAAVFAGCEQNNPPAAPTTAPTAEAPTAPTPTQIVAPAVPTAPATETVPTAPAATQAATAAATEVQAATATGTAEASALNSQAQTLLTQVVDYVKANKLDLAQKAMDQLNQIKPKLPVALQKQIDNEQQMLAAAKLKNSIKLPGQ